MIPGLRKPTSTTRFHYSREKDVDFQCYFCGILATVFHHVLLTGSAGMGIKPDDFFAIAICHLCHASAHNAGISIADQVAVVFIANGFRDLGQFNNKWRGPEALQCAARILFETITIYRECLDRDQIRDLFLDRFNSQTEGPALDG